MKSIDTEREFNIHSTHCCSHGCKYGEDTCPVINKQVEPKYLCMCTGEQPDNSGLTVYCIELRYFEWDNEIEESVVLHVSSTIPFAIDWIKEHGLSYGEPTMYKPKFAVYGMVTDMEQDYDFLEYFNLDGSRQSYED